MLPYTSGYSTPVPSSSSLHFHASLPSHLTTELALLQTFIKRASAQHRSQLFLQRMEGILRVGKSMLLHIRKVSEERKGEACIAWRWKGENLIKKMIKMLFGAHYITLQIIDLYHFLPLQTTVLSIYARLFTVTVSLANSLEMDVEQLLVFAGKATNGKRRMGPEENQKTNKVATGTLVAGAIKDMGMDVEMGEVIERSRSSQSLGRVSRSTRGSTIVSESVELPASLQMDQLLDSIPFTNIAEDEKKKKKKRVVKDEDGKSDEKTRAKKKKRKEDAMDDIFGF
ncbi:uncharacterized protein IAS62_001094 [Cryptococcus decagattii]|uniref:Uncharacterized protein n=1 Tax=Cryptococcus decagattii TaxID=1859122 RepID=A0ABZ2ANK5_9TREE